MGPGFFFAKSIVNATDRPVGLIPCAYGGTSTIDWDPARKAEGGASLYGATLERIAMVGGNIKGILWYQGESDAGSAELASAYKQTFLNLVDSFRQDTGIADLPFIYVQIGRLTASDLGGTHGWEQVREAQRTAAAKRENLHVVSAIDLPLDDIIHISFDGHIRLGARLAQVALREVYGVEGCAGPIDVESVEIIEPVDMRNRIKVRFSGVSGKLRCGGEPTGFELRPREQRPGKPSIYRMDFEAQDPAAVILRHDPPIGEPIDLYYGAGLNPYVNIVDEKDIPIPAFGPVEIKPAAWAKES